MQRDFDVLVLLGFLYIRRVYNETNIWDFTFD